MPIRPPVHNPYNAARERQTNARQQGYTPQWDKVSKLYRAQHPLCLGCEAIGDITPAQCVDHVIPHRGNAALMWDMGNLQPLCRWHHDMIKQQLEIMHMRGEITDHDLRIDSPIAVRISRKFREKDRGGGRIS